MKMTLVVFFVTQALRANFVYDGELKQFFDRERPDFEYLKKRNEQTAQRYPNVINESTSLVASALKKPYTIFDDGNQQILCLFVTPNNDSSSYPFVRLFNDIDEKQHKGKLVVGSFCYEAKMLDLQVLELFDAEVSSENLTQLSNVTSIRHLGLPARGISFLKGITFPPNTETLVVRNGFLNVHFFDALKDLKHLRNVVINGCSVYFKSPQNAGFGYSLSTWDKLPRFFESIAPRVRHLRLVNSSPSILNHLIREKWSSLEKFELCLYPQNVEAVDYVFDREKRELANFPKLKELIVKEYGYNHRNLEITFENLRVKKLIE